MYLKKIHIKNFRCIENLTINFHENINILIGENNAGKTAIIDALRICLGLGSERKEIYLNIDDFLIKNGKRTDQIEFDIHYDVGENEAAYNYELSSILSPETSELQLHVRYTIENKNGMDKIRIKFWGGDNEGQNIPPEVLENFIYVHLGALRDAERDLKPSRNNRLSLLFTKLDPDPIEQNQKAEKLQNLFNEDPDWTGLINRGTEIINNRLKESSIIGKNQQVNINLLPFEFRKIVETLKIQVNESGSRFEISQNGLGYNNLIYIATILGDLSERKKRNEDSLICLFIEEPEAHLHPQLQSILYEFFKGLCNLFQIFITSHSPTITSKAGTENLIVLQKIESRIQASRVYDFNLELEEKKYLSRFLDITKCQLFYANSVIIVEGISEALLLPVFADIMGEKYNLNKHGVEIVNINGVAFEPFAKLFNSSDEAKRLHSRCSIITDRDPDKGAEQSARAQKVKTYEGNNLKVFFATNTLEKDLFDASENNVRIIKEIYACMHTRTPIDSSNTLLEKLKSNGDKARLAQNLAERLVNDNNFIVPDYIQNAIKWAVRG